MGQGFDQEVSLFDVLVYLKKGSWLITLCMLLCGIITVIGTLVFEKEVYEASSTVIMAKESARIFYDDEYTKSDMDLYQETGNTYIEIAKSNIVIDGAAQILEQQGLKYTRREIKELVSAHYITGTLIIKLFASSSNGDNVCAIANAYRESFINTANALLPVSTLQVVDIAEVPVTPKTSGLKKNMILGCIAGGAIAFCIIFLKYILDRTKIQSAEEVEELFGIKVIANFKDK